MIALKRSQIGNAVEVDLSKELLPWPKLERGDMVFVTDAANEAMLTLCDKAFESQMAAARVMTMLSVAASQVDEATFAAWLRENTGAAPR